MEAAKSAAAASPSCASRCTNLYLLDVLNGPDSNLFELRTPLRMLAGPFYIKVWVEVADGRVGAPLSGRGYGQYRPSWAAAAATEEGGTSTTLYWIFHRDEKGKFFFVSKCSTALATFLQ